MMKSGRKLSVRRQAILGFLCIFTLVIFFALFVANRILTSQLQAFETELAETNARRAANAVLSDIGKLDALVKDWAWWEDSVAFLEGRAPDYIDDNITPGVFKDQALDAIIFQKPGGEVFHGASCADGEVVAADAELVGFAVNSAPHLGEMTSDVGFKGILSLGQDFWLMACRPILDSQGRGPLRGWLWMMRRITDSVVAEWAERTELSLDLTVAASETVPASLAQYAGSAGSGSPPWVLLEGETLLSALTLPNGSGGPPLILVTRTPRTLNRIGQHIARAYIILGVVMAGLGVLGGAAFLNRKIFSRLESLSRRIAANARELVLETQEATGDELDRLDRIIDRAFESVRENEAFLEKTMDSIQAGLMLVDKADRRIVRINAFACNLIGYSEKDIVGSTCHRFICPEEMGQCPVLDMGGQEDTSKRLLLKADGTPVNILKSVAPIVHHGREYLLETFIDITDLEHTRRLLEESEERYRTIFMNTGTAVVIIDDDTSILLANREFLNLAGVTTKELDATLSWTRFFPPDERERLLTYHQRRRNHSESAPRSYTTRFLDAAGNLRHVELTVALIPHTRQSIASLVDITDMKQAQERLARSEKNFKAIVDNSLEGIFIAQDGLLVFVNPMMERMSGLRREELLNRPFIDLVHPDDREMVSRYHTARMAGEPVPAVYDCRMLSGGEDFIWVMTSAVVCEWNEKPAALAMLSDISGRKKAEAAFREAEARYRDIFENAPVAIFRAMPEGRFLVVNPCYAAMAGFDSPEAMLAGVTDIAAQMYVEPAQREVYKRQLSEHGAVRNFEAQLKRRDGNEFWASMTSRAVRDEAGRIVSYDGFLVDVTERKAAEEALKQARDTLELQVAARTLALQQANKRLVELDQQRASFLSSASHELRTPLTSVLGFAKLARRTFSRHFEPLAGSGEVLKRKSDLIMNNLDIIEQEGERLTRLINDLLDLNKIEAGRMEWRDARLNVAHELESASTAMQGAFASKLKVRFDLRVAEDAGTIVADRDRLRQMLLNLLSNAIKYTDEGYVRLEAGPLPDGGLQIRVEDSGQGIAEEDRERIFQKFYQSHSGHPEKAKPEGTGLGLPICRHIVEHYGGSIRVASHTGRGSVFLVEFPPTIRAAG